MKHHVTKTMRRVLRRRYRKATWKVDANGKLQALELSEAEFVDESVVKYDSSSDSCEFLEVELADHPSSAPSELTQVEQTDDPSTQKGFWRKLWEKIEGNLIWDLIKIVLGTIATWICLIFPQLKTATFEKAAVSIFDYMAKVLADVHVVITSLF